MDIVKQLLEGYTPMMLFIFICLFVLMVMFLKTMKSMDAVIKAIDVERRSLGDMVAGVKLQIEDLIRLTSDSGHQLRRIGDELSKAPRPAPAAVDIPASIAPQAPAPQAAPIAAQAPVAPSVVAAAPTTAPAPSAAPTLSQSPDKREGLGTAAAIGLAGAGIGAAAAAAAVMAPGEQAAQAKLADFTPESLAPTIPPTQTAPHAPTLGPDFFEDHPLNETLGASGEFQLHADAVGDDALLHDLEGLDGLDLDAELEDLSLADVVSAAEAPAPKAASAPTEPLGNTPPPQAQPAQTPTNQPMAIKPDFGDAQTAVAAPEEPSTIEIIDTLDGFTMDMSGDRTIPEPGARQAKPELTPDEALDAFDFGDDDMLTKSQARSLLRDGESLARTGDVEAAILGGENNLVDTMPGKNQLDEEILLATGDLSAFEPPQAQAPVHPVQTQTMAPQPGKNAALSDDGMLELTEESAFLLDDDEDFAKTVALKPEDMARLMSQTLAPTAQQTAATPPAPSVAAASADELSSGDSLMNDLTSLDQMEEDADTFILTDDFDLSQVQDAAHGQTSTDDLMAESMFFDDDFLNDELTAKIEESHALAPNLPPDEEDLDAALAAGDSGLSLGGADEIDLNDIVFEELDMSRTSQPATGAAKAAKVGGTLDDLDLLDDLLVLEEEAEKSGVIRKPSGFVLED